MASATASAKTKDTEIIIGGLLAVGVVVLILKPELFHLDKIKDFFGELKSNIENLDLGNGGLLLGIGGYSNGNGNGSGSGSGSGSGTTQSSQADLKNYYSQCENLYPLTERRKNPELKKKLDLCRQTAREEVKKKAREWIKTHPVTPGADDDSPCSRIIENWQAVQIPANINPQQFYQQYIDRYNSEITQYTQEKQTFVAQCKQQAKQIYDYNKSKITTEPPTSSISKHIEALYKQALSGCAGKGHDSIINSNRKRLEQAKKDGPVVFTKKRLAHKLGHECFVQSGRREVKRQEQAELDRQIALDAKLRGQNYNKSGSLS